MKAFRKVIFKTMKKGNLTYEFFRPWNDDDFQGEMVKIFALNGKPNLKLPHFSFNLETNKSETNRFIPALRYNFNQK